RTVFYAGWPNACFFSVLVVVCCISCGYVLLLDAGYFSFRQVARARFADSGRGSCCSKSWAAWCTEGGDTPFTRWLCSGQLTSEKAESAADKWGPWASNNLLPGLGNLECCMGRRQRDGIKKSS